MLRENTAASELLWTVGGQISVKDSFDFEFQSRLHECEATTAGDQSILFAGSRYAFVCRLFCCPKAGYNGMTGWMGYDFAKTSCVNRESETTLRLDSGAGTEKRHLGKPAKKEEKMCP